MPITALSLASSYNPGADLWILPERKNCGLTQRLDWYLNFQISRAAKHATQALPERVSNILAKTGLPHLDFIETKRECLLIPSSNLLPNRWVVVIRGSDDFETWVEVAFKRWTEMRKPSLRLFLPTGKDLTDFQKAWRKYSDYNDFNVILDS